MALHLYYTLSKLYAQGLYYMFISTFLINTCVQSLLLWVGMILVEESQMNAEVLIAFMLVRCRMQLYYPKLPSTETHSTILLWHLQVSKSAAGKFVHNSLYYPNSVAFIDLIYISLTYSSYRMKR